MNQQPLTHEALPEGWSPPWDPAPFQEALLRWYTEHSRDLPFRQTRDPYAIWVSEIMLQQTRMEVGILYYQRWMERFPTVESLADAPLDEVLKRWEGLGYYGRARNLHRAAARVVDSLGGRLPDTVEGWIALPGVGPYTAGAITSIAHGLDEAVLDGNVVRILSRLVPVGQPPSRAPVKSLLWGVARQLLPPGRAGEFNQALMDLGATVCTPRNPRCDDGAGCPIRRWCAGYAQGTASSLPAKGLASRRIPRYQVGVGVVIKGEAVLVTKRPADGLLGGLWEFPGGKRLLREPLERCVAREVMAETGVDVRPGRLLTVVRHAYSHFKVELHVYRCDWVSGTPQPLRCTECRWAAGTDLDALAFPSANRKFMDLVKRQMELELEEERDLLIAEEGTDRTGV